MAAPVGQLDAGHHPAPHGPGFTYVDAAGRRVIDRDVLERMRALAIPPAWTDVWICADAMGHIQAPGTDTKGRRQYRYHDRWRERRDREKFEHMLSFAAALPRLRNVAAKHLDLGGLPRERVLACGAFAGSRVLPRRYGGLRRGEPDLRPRHDPQEARAHSTAR